MGQDSYGTFLKSTPVQIKTSHLSEKQGGGGHCIVGLSESSQTAHIASLRSSTISVINTASEGFKTSHRAISSKVRQHDKHIS